MPTDFASNTDETLKSNDTQYSPEHHFGYRVDLGGRGKQEDVSRLTVFRANLLYHAPLGIVILEMAPMY